MNPPTGLRTIFLMTSGGVSEEYIQRRIIASRNCTICVRNVFNSFTDGRVTVQFDGTYAESVRVRSVRASCTDSTVTRPACW